MSNWESERFDIVPEIVEDVITGIIRAERLAAGIVRNTTDLEAKAWAREIQTVLAHTKEMRDLAVIHLGRTDSFL